MIDGRTVIVVRCLTDAVANERFTTYAKLCKVYFVSFYFECLHEQDKCMQAPSREFLALLSHSSNASAALVIDASVTDEQADYLLDAICASSITVR